MPTLIRGRDMSIISSFAQGDMVAALVKGPEDENWILAEVVAYNSVTGKYDVDDIDEEQKDRHTLSKRLTSHIISQITYNLRYDCSMVIFMILMKLLLINLGKTIFP